jgi:hypothetical protein
MDVLADEKRKLKTDIDFGEILANYADYVLDNEEYDESIYGDDEDLNEEEKDNREFCSFFLMEAIRYKLFKQVGDPIRDDWIER